MRTATSSSSRTPRPLWIDPFPRLTDAAPVREAPHRFTAMDAALAVCIMLVLALVPAAPARGQGAAPFAEPLSSADLARWVTRLELEGDARRAAEAAFEKALAESQALRDGELAAFERDAMGPNNPAATLESLEQRSKRAKSLVARQAAIEDRLFQELAALVPESRHGVVEAERRAALRRRSTAALDQFQRSGVSPDLIEIVRRAEGVSISGDAVTLLVDYDRRLTDQLQRASTLSLESGPEIRRARDAAEARLAAEAGASGDAGAGADGAPAEVDSGRAMRQRMRAAMEARDTALAPLQEVRASIVSLHRSTFERLVQALPADQAAALRGAFIQAHYQPIAARRDAPDRLLREIRSRAEADGSVPAETAAAAERLVDAWRTRADDIEGRMMDAIDEQRRERAAGPRFMPDGDGATMRFGDDGPLEELRNERHDAAVDARNQIAALHPAFKEFARPETTDGVVTIAGVPGAGPQRVEARAAMIVTSDGGGAEAMTIDLGSNAIIGSHGGLRPIEPREFDAMMARLGRTGAERDVARAAFDDYRAAAEARLRAILDVPAKEGDAPAVPGVNANVVVTGGGAVFMSGDPPAPEKLDAAAAKLAADDDAFFAALGTSDDPGLARERAIRARERLRQRLALGAGGPMFRPWGRFDRVDLPAIVAETKLPEDRRDHANAMAAAQGERMTAMLARLLEAQEKLRRLESEFMRTTVQADGRIERSLEIDAGGTDEWPRAMRAAEEADRAITDDVRRALTELHEQLPPDAARTIRRAAYAQAMPQIAADPRSVEERVEEAIMLDSISDETRVALIELLASHQNAVDALVDRFVDDAEQQERDRASARGPGPNRGPRSGPGAGPGPGPGPELRAMGAMRTSDRLQSRLRFDRSELNDATMRRLRALLNDEQNAQIADLPAPAASRMAAFAFPF